MVMPKVLYRIGYIFNPPGCHCAMASMGGVGSTALARHIGSIADKSPREHAFSPSLYDHEQDLRLGYMFGNPCNAVLSVFRRDYQDMHVQAMNSGSPTPAVSLKGVTIEKFLERGVDELHIERQFDNWTNPANCKHPTILIKYEAMADNIDKVLEFFRCKSAFTVKARTSSWRNQPEPIRRGLEKYYGNLIAKVDAMPGLQILNPR